MGLGLFTEKKNFARSGDAKYVQLIHTSLGTAYHTGDCNIEVGTDSRQKREDFGISHLRVFELCYLTATQMYAFVVSKSTTKIYNLVENPMRIEDIPVGKDDCMVGMYNTDRKHGKFTLEVPKDVFEFFDDEDDDNYDNDSVKSEPQIFHMSP